ncbi:MAG: hypothetical protein AVDCRST_MAG50-538 [uncultured Acidimicrobiales bacterium]|uniref:Uncharacterized protein n=1 Tax=uncultured Acidimicrobiales bacterium TaxID=310071 RepID=A0A6J4HBN5_9ACTN|nr:MAG: hypothetical protein AVDCRST_MAG50-538 [uncultured Acidimicrobiales bacterium]
MQHAAPEVDRRRRRLQHAHVGNGSARRDGSSDEFTGLGCSPAAHSDAGMTSGRKSAVRAR